MSMYSENRYYERRRRQRSVEGGLAEDFDKKYSYTDLDDSSQIDDETDEKEGYGEINIVRSKGGCDWVEIEYLDFARVFWGEKSKHFITENTRIYAYVPMGSVEYELFDLVSEQTGVEDDTSLKRIIEGDFEGWCNKFNKELHDIFFEYAEMQSGVYIEWADGEKAPGFHLISVPSVIARNS